MPDRQLQDELRRRLAQLEVPEDSEARAVEAALRGLAQRRAAEEQHQPALPAGKPAPRRRGTSAWRRRPAVVLAILVLGGGAAGAVGVTQPWDRETAPLVGTTREAAERIATDPLLANLAWIVDKRGPDGGPTRIQDLPPSPSLRFPPGVSFEQAFARIYASLADSGALPPEATLGPPLPLGKTLAVPADPSLGIAIDLRSPRGYLLPGGALPLGFASPPGLSRAESERRLSEAARQGLVVPLGFIIPTPDLKPCQILDPANPTPSCLSE